MLTPIFTTSRSQKQPAPKPSTGVYIDPRPQHYRLIGLEKWVGTSAACVTRDRADPRMLADDYAKCCEQQYVTTDAAFMERNASGLTGDLVMFSRMLVIARNNELWGVSVPLVVYRSKNKDVVIVDQNLSPPPMLWGLPAEPGAKTKRLMNSDSLKTCTYVCAPYSIGDDEFLQQLAGA